MDSVIQTVLIKDIQALLKLAAAAIYKSRQAVLQLRKELDAERAKTAALEAELRALKATGPPIEDLLGLTATHAPKRVWNVVEDCTPTLSASNT